MPKKFEDMLTSIKSELKGKTNPKTKKTYTDSEIYAIAVSSYKKKNGSAPSKESSPSWYWNGTQEIRENVPLNWQEDIVIERAKPSARNDVDTPLKISGIAINETITKNRVKYVSEELEMAVPTLIGKKILNSHNHDDVREALGIIKNAYMQNGAIAYEAEIDPDETKIINKIKRGYIDKVSISGNVKELVKEEVKESDGKFSTHFMAKGLELNELSLVTVPGDDNSSVNLMGAVNESFNNNEVTEQLNEIIEKNLEEDLKKNKKEDENMEDVKKLEEQIAQLKEQNSKLSESVEVSKAKEAEVAESARIEKLVAEKVAKALEVKEAEEDKEITKEEIVEEPKEEDKETEESAKSKSIVENGITEADNKYIVEKSNNGIDFFMMPNDKGEWK